MWSGGVRARGPTASFPPRCASLGTPSIGPFNPTDKSPGKKGSQRLMTLWDLNDLFRIHGYVNLRLLSQKIMKAACHAMAFFLVLGEFCTCLTGFLDVDIDGIAKNPIPWSCLRGQDA